MEINIYCEKNTDSVVLPICMPPPVQAYLPFSIISTIITANTNSYDWLYNNFIQLYQKTNLNRIDTYPNQDFLFTDHAAITCTELNGLNYHVKEDTFVENIIDWVKRGNYIILYLNEAYVKGTRGYKGNDRMHAQFVFGYSLKDGVFKVMNFSQDTLKMEVLNIKFEDLKEAFFCEGTKALYHREDVHGIHKGKEFKIILMRHRQTIDNTYSVGFNVEAINEAIKAYFYEENSSLKHPFFTGVQEGNWGMGVYKALEEFIEQGEKLHLTSLYLLNEHKLFMTKRFKKIEELDICDGIASRYSHILEKADMLTTAGLKYYMTQSPKSKAKVQRLLDEIYHEEKEVLNHYLTQIR